MAKDKFCFVQTSPFGQSKEARKLEQLRARAHAASVCPRRKRTSFQIIHDVLHVPAPQLNISAAAYGLPFSPQSPNDQSPDSTHQLSSTGAICASSSARPLSPPETPEAWEEEQDITNEGQAETMKVKHSEAFRRPVAGDLIVRNRGVGLIPSDYRCFRGMRTDPFDCIPARGSESVSSVVDYHAQIMAPNHAPIYAIFNVTNVYTSYYFELLQHEDFLYTGVASVQAVIDQLRTPGQKPSQNVLRHIGKAMSNLRRRLERPGATGDDLTIMTVLFLAAAARAIGDMSSHEVHKKSIARLVSSRGGLDCLGHDGLAKCTLMQWESFWALNTGSSIFPEARPAYTPIYPDIPFSEDLCLLISKLPPGFQALAKQRKLAIDVLEVLARASDAEQMQKRTGSVVQPVDVFRSRPARYHDFWEACSCLAAPDVDGPNFEKLIVLALLLYCLHAFSPMRAVTAVYNGSRMTLTNVIRKTRKGCVEEEECLMWIWMVLVDSWRNVSEKLLPTGIELVDQLRERWGYVRDWSEVAETLGSFFWDKAFASRCRFYWHPYGNPEWMM